VFLARLAAAAPLCPQAVRLDWTEPGTLVRPRSGEQPPRNNGRSRACRLADCLRVVAAGRWNRDLCPLEMTAPWRHGASRESRVCQDASP
jgi:hypothetical protein